ncbi:MAG: AAA family ATPase [Rhizobiales bacterium]|nr:AAA family ATPase [Hyphomicrobiales bacterium]
MAQRDHRPKIVGVVGLSGVGKTEAVQYLGQRADFERVYFGGVVLSEVRSRGLEVTPANEAVVREDLRRHFGMDVIAARSIPEIERALKAGRHVLIDGLYSYSEYKLLRSSFGDAVQLIAIHSRKTVRAQRLGTRLVRPLTPKEMTVRDEREVETLEKAEPIALADYHIVNDSNIECFKVSLSDCFEAIMSQ